jgi:hypothetical protein
MKKLIGLFVALMFAFATPALANDLPTAGGPDAVTAGLYAGSTVCATYEFMNELAIAATTDDVESISTLFAENKCAMARVDMMIELLSIKNGIVMAWAFVEEDVVMLIFTLPEFVSSAEDLSEDKVFKE